MKKIFGHLVIPFWAQHFSTLRVDENVLRGHFRIGQLILETKLSNCCVIIAKLTPAPKEEIQEIAFSCATIISYSINKYIEGLICASEFLNEITTAVVRANNDVNNSCCNMRLPQCKECPATKIKGDAEHEARELSHYEWLNANRIK